LSEKPDCIRFSAFQKEKLPWIFDKIRCSFFVFEKVKGLAPTLIPSVS
jgi:hypothetical protein